MRRRIGAEAQSVRRPRGGDRVEHAGGEPLTGLAEDVDRDGRLVVVTATGRTVVAAGDVTHVRPADRS